ncbi:MAG: hypothetical protein IKB97_09440 [Bacteroidaceae bacterium]|nr:hypothetical protein [Bacteroidaceae bacterium]
MKKKTFFLLLLIALLYSCGKLELPTDGETDEGNGEEENTEQPIPIPQNDTLSVAQFRERLEVGEASWLKGYIVGYVEGNSLKQSVFDVPFDGENTNMLLADSPHETDYANCLPVKLANTGSYAFRRELNLYDHPEYLGQYIALLGLKWNYFRTIGVFEIYDYEWLPVPAATEKSTPSLVHEAQLIPEGR